MTVAAAIAQLAAIKAFFLAGHAKFTLVSKHTGERKTFQVRKNDDRGWFVDLLVGPENTSDFRYLCYLWKSADGSLYARMNKEHWGTEPYAAVVWLIGWFNGIGRIGWNEAKFFEQVEFWHSGTCSRCGRELTDPESIARGLGPVCAEKS